MARRAQVEQWEAELARLRNEQQPGWDSIVHVEWQYRWRMNESQPWSSWMLCDKHYPLAHAKTKGMEFRPLYTAPPRPDASGLIEAAEWLDRQATAHERDASDEPDDDKPVMTEGDCSKAIAGYLRKAAHNLRVRAADRSAK